MIHVPVLLRSIRRWVSFWVSALVIFTPHSYRGAGLLVYAQSQETGFATPSQESTREDPQRSGSNSGAPLAPSTPLSKNPSSLNSTSSAPRLTSLSRQTPTRDSASPTRPPSFIQRLLTPTPREPEINTGRLSDTLVALVPGSLLHGLGHWYRGDLDAAKKILFLEGLGILSILGGYTLNTLVDQDHYSKRLGEQWLYHTGGVLFITSWLADIIGSFRGDLPSRGLLRIEHPRSVAIGYRYRDDPQSQHSHHWVAQLNYSTQKLRFSGSLNWESQGQVVGLEGVAMGSVYQHDRQANNFMSQIELGVRVKRWTWLTDELTQWLVIPQIEGTLGLNHLSSGLRGYALFHRVGLGWERFDLAPLAQSSPETSSLVSYPLVMESGLKIHPYSSLIVSFSLIEDNTLDMRPKNQSGLFWGGSVFFQQTDQIAIKLNALWGDDWSTWIMLSFSQERER